MKKRNFLGPGQIKGLCPVCKTVQALYLGEDGSIVDGPFYIVPHEQDGEECYGSRRFVPDERKN